MFDVERATTTNTTSCTTATTTATTANQSVRCNSSWKTALVLSCTLLLLLLLPVLLLATARPIIIAEDTKMQQQETTMDDFNPVDLWDQMNEYGELQDITGLVVYREFSLLT